MYFANDPALARVVTGLIAVLALATTVGRVLRRRARTASGQATLSNVNTRIAAWWVMSAVVLSSLFAGPIGSVTLFSALSFVALREFVTLMPTRRADHRVLLIAFFVVIPLQYLLVAIEWYGLFAVLIPIGGSLWVATRTAVAGDTERFTARIAEIQFALLVCVYAVSHVPALLMLRIPEYAGQNAKLLLFLIVVVESSDVLQYIWGKLCGRHRIAPTVSPGKTVEGFVGGVVSATLLGAALWQLTPFDPWQAAAVSLTATTAGFAGGLVMSAVKRDRRVKDFGTVIAGHGGVLDRIDSLCFAGPVFFHMTRYFFAM
jgi:phosphatidate cytidylyltransferase